MRIAAAKSRVHLARSPGEVIAYGGLIQTRKDLCKGRPPGREREFFIDNLLLRIHFIIEMIWWTGLAPWEFEFSFPGSLTSTFLVLYTDT